MHIESHVGTEELGRRIKHAKHPKLRQRLRIVYWAMQGETADQIADRVGLSRRRVQEWVARYNAAGLEGLSDRSGRGRKLPLDENQTQQLMQRLDAGPLKSDGVCSFTGHVIQQLIEQELNTTLSLSATYYLLHAIGYSWLVPRPRHPQADPEKQEAFKKGTPSQARGIAAFAS